MTFQHGATVAAPLDEVFGWHARPGAITRLLPPWQPVSVIEEPQSLRDGRAVLGLPGRIRWVAQHQPDKYDPPHRFADELVSLPFRAGLQWQHTHEFRRAGEAATEVVDSVETNVPDRFLRRTFAYRQRELAGDLAAHNWARAYRGEPLRVALTGSSGLVGTALEAFLTTGGHQVVRLVRHPPTGPHERHWRPDAPDIDLLDGIDAVVHLAGASIAGRFTAEHKRRIRSSRVEPTAALARVAALAAARGGGPTGFVSASAIGIYGHDRGDEILTETSPPGEGFLAEVVRGWEEAAAPAREAGVRVVHVRTGLVQSPRGATLRLLLPLFEVGLGGRLGSGRQWMSWIGIDDLVDVYYRAVVDARLAGPVNAVAPDPVRNADYTDTLAGILRRPAVVPVPAFGPRLLLGAEGATELAQASQRVRPEQLLSAGHAFRHPQLEPALRHLLGRSENGVHEV
jgi:uncharacterized protein (TIGR01777 family)